MLRDTRHPLEQSGAEIHAASDASLAQSLQAPNGVKSARSAQFGGLSPEMCIKTVWGEKPLREISVGHRILTRDNGYQKVRWVGCISHGINSRLVVIRANALGSRLPVNDLVLSPRQRILSGTGLLKSLCKASEALVRVKDLLHLDGVDIQQEAAGVLAQQVLLDRHELILANDIWTETFQPDAKLIARLPRAQRETLQNLCPKLTRSGCRRAFPSARSQMRLKGAINQVSPG